MLWNRWARPAPLRDEDRGRETDTECCHSLDSVRWTLYLSSRHQKAPSRSSPTLWGLSTHGACPLLRHRMTKSFRYAHTRDSFPPTSSYSSQLQLQHPEH